MSDDIPSTEAATFTPPPTDRLRAFGLGPEPTALVLGIAALAFMITSWVTGFIDAQRWLSFGATELGTFFANFLERDEARELRRFLSELHVSGEDYRRWLGMGYVGLSIRNFLSPIFGLFGLAITSALAAVLLPAFGADRDRASFSKILVVQLYAGCLTIVAVLPWVGSFLSGILIFLASIIGTARMSGTSWFQSFVALKVLSIAAMVVGIVLSLLLVTVILGVSHA